MTDFDLLVRGPERDVGIRDGVFQAVGPNLSGSAGSEIDATALAVFPGVIDSHVHFNEPGRTDWEGWETGSRAAAAGGTTMVFDMPLNSHPPTVDGPSFDAKRAAAETTSLVDFGLWGGLVPGNIDDLATLYERGVVGLKAFMSDSGIGDFECVDERVLRAGMKRASELGMIVAVHAESNEITRRLSQESRAAGGSSVRDYLDSRPVRAELEAIRMAIELAGETGCRLHIVHVSSGAGVQLVAAGREQGVDVTCETCPHYLVLAEDDMIEIGAVAKCAPPLRSAEEQRDLWEQLDAISTIGSDHSPSPPDLKERSNFFQVWGGISGCQHLLPLLVDRLGVDASACATISRLTSTSVASRFAFSRKGGIEVGKDADFSIVDFGHEGVVETNSLHYRHRQSPYVGRRLRGRIVSTFLRGQRIFSSDAFPARPFGKFVRPSSPQ